MTDANENNAGEFDFEAERQKLHEVVANLTPRDIVHVVTCPVDDLNKVRSVGNAAGYPLVAMTMSMIIALGHDALNSQGEEGDSDMALFTGLQVVTDTTNLRAEELKKERGRHFSDTVTDEVHSAEGPGDKNVH